MPSGGDIDPLLMLRVIEHGLAAAGRFLRFTVRCVDRPGQSARMLTLIAEYGANVVDVAHERHDPRLRIGEVEVALSVETRGSQHSDEPLAGAARRRVRGDLPRLNQWATTAGPRRRPTGKHQVATQPVYGSSLVTVTLTSAPLGAV